jgi:RNA polymerase sigma-70 factor (ECF subfamily)
MTDDELLQYLTDHRADMIRFAAYRLRVHRLSDTDADDVIQQSFIKIWRNREAAMQNPYGYVMKTIYNVVRDTARHHYCQVPTELPPSLAAPVHHDPSDTQRAVRAAIERLPEEYRESAWLRWAEDQPLKTIAQRLGVTTDAVKWQLRQAKRLLRRSLAQTWRDAVYDSGVTHTLQIRSNGGLIRFPRDGMDPAPAPVVLYDGAGYPMGWMDPLTKERHLYEEGEADVA